MKISPELLKKQRKKDKTIKGFCLSSAILTTLVLGAVFLYIALMGVQSLSLKFLTNDYWSENLMLSYEDVSMKAGGSVQEEGGAIYIPRLGIRVQEARNQHKDTVIRIQHMDEDSPLLKGRFTVAANEGKNKKKVFRNASIVTATVEGAKGAEVVGSQMKTDLHTFAETLQEGKLLSLYIQTPGGGIRGSMIATLMLLFVSMVIALPLGVFAAIYLQEYAKKNRFTAMLRSSIEMLSGVPSIVFGLMGVAVLFPVTALFGADGMSILLGGFTMAVILLPVVIRQSEEALLTVPKGLRDSSLAMGATKVQTIFRVVLRKALPGLLSAALLSVSRVIGESAALIYTMGTVISDQPKMTEGATSLSVMIWSIMSREQPDLEQASAISLIILVIVLFLNILVKSIVTRYSKKWEA